MSRIALVLSAVALLVVLVDVALKPKTYDPTLPCVPGEYGVAEAGPRAGKLSVCVETRRTRDAVFVAWAAPPRG